MSKSYQKEYRENMLEEQKQRYRDKQKMNKNKNKEKLIDNIKKKKI